MGSPAARAFTGRSKIAKVDGAYYGLYGTVATNGRNGSGDTMDHTTVSNLPGAPQAMTDQIVILPFNETEASTEIILQQKDELSAVIVGPMMGAAGFMPATGEYLKAIREVTSQEGIVLVFDEVCSLRAGYGAAQGLFG